MIDHWQEMTDFWLKMGGLNMAGSPPGPRCEQGKDLCQGLMMEVSELTDSFQWKPWREGVDIDKDNVRREIIDCLFFLHHIAHNFGISRQDLLNEFREVMNNNVRRYVDGDFSGEEEPRVPASNQELAQINAKLDQLINGDVE